MAVQAVPGFDLQPSSQQVPVSTNYLSSADFTWLQQYLPDTYEKEFERYGNRTVASFLRMVGAEMPSNSDLIKWAEQGRLHNKYRGLTTASAPGSDTATFVIPAADFDPALVSPNLAALRAGQTVMLSSSVAGSTLSAKGIITAAPAGAAAPTEEKTEFTIMLTAAGDKKINVIKEVRAVTALGLKEAKDLVEGAPKEVKSGVNKKEADEIKAKLEAAGAKVELK